MPFAVNSDNDRINLQKRYVSHLKLFLDHDDHMIFIEGQILSGPRGADKIWNMICLSPTMHTLWSKMIFGLKVLGHIPDSDGSKSILTLQFYWFQQNKTCGGDIVEPTTEEIQRMVSVDYTSGESGCEAVNLTTCRKIQTGDCFQIKMDTEDVRKAACMFRFIWNLGIAVRLRGQAPVPDVFPDEDEDDQAVSEDQGDFEREPSPTVLDWLKDVDAQRKLQRK